MFYKTCVKNLNEIYVIYSDVWKGWKVNDCSFSPTLFLLLFVFDERREADEFHVYLSLFSRFLVCPKIQRKRKCCKNWAENLQSAGKKIKIQQNSRNANNPLLKYVCDGSAPRAKRLCRECQLHSRRRSTWA